MHRITPSTSPHQLWTQIKLSETGVRRQFWRGEQCLFASRSVKLNILCKAFYFIKRVIYIVLVATQWALSSGLELSAGWQGLSMSRKVCRILRV
jgi:hypothetical protein